MPKDLTDNVVWTYATLEHNLPINHKSTKYMKEDCYLVSDQHCFFKYVLRIAFVGEIAKLVSQIWLL